MTELPTISLDRLKVGLPAISPAFGAFLAEAAAVCLHHSQHPATVRWEILGDHPAETQLLWTGELSEQVLNSWRDLQEATEYGATGMAPAAGPGHDRPDGRQTFGQGYGL
jgi:hypothetical protein